MNTFLSVVIALVGFSILVFFHEFGHFLMALFFRIKVEKFSIGMGPAIWGFKKGDTFFQIGAIPFGGFCKFKGDEFTDNFEASKDPDSFFGVKPHKRLLVALCGPFMNYLLAIVFLTVLAMGNHTENFLPGKILLVDDLYPLDNKQAAETPAKKGGLLSQDIITKIDNKVVHDYYDISRNVYSKEKTLKIEVNRNGEILTREIKPVWDPELMKNIIGLTIFIDPVIDNSNTNESYLNNVLKLKDGDRVTGIDNDYSNWCEEKVGQFLKKYYSTNKRSILHIDRNGKTLDIPIVFNEINHKVLKKYFFLKFHYPEKNISGKWFVPAVSEGFKESNDIIQMSVFGLSSLIFKPKKNIANQLGGPIFIGYLIGDSTIEAFKESPYKGIRNFLNIISMISLALAFFNLLPIPALDGGYILMNIIEIITRKPINLKFIYIINLIFFLILILLGIFVASLDITKIQNIFK